VLRQNSLETASAKEAAQIAEYERDNEVKKVDPFPDPFPHHFPDVIPQSLTLIVTVI
jgi:hypothetical protein